MVHEGHSIDIYRPVEMEKLDVLLRDSCDFDKMQNAINELGKILNPLAINRLVEISDEDIVIFLIFRVNNKILYAAAPSRYKITKTEFVGYDHDGRGGWIQEYVVSGNGEIKVPFETCLRGTLVDKIDSEKGFLRLDTPIRDEEIALYCETKGIPKDQFKDALIDDFKAILEKLGEITNKNKRLILLDSLRDMYREQKGIEIPEDITLSQALKLMRGEGVKLTEGSGCFPTPHPEARRAEGSIEILRFAQDDPFIREKNSPRGQLTKEVANKQNSGLEVEERALLLRTCI